MTARSTRAAFGRCVSMSPCESQLSCEPVSINYLVHDNAVGYQIRDVFLTGTISELATRRSEFATILRSNGIDGLIASLNKKADDLQG